MIWRIHKPISTNDEIQKTRKSNIVTNLGRCGQMVMSLVNKEELIDKPSKTTTNQRPNPVNPVIGPGPAHQSGSKRHSWVH
ncbi:hypothetical protein Hanom_Chr11g01056161 [Helianthus anomalus]